MGQAAFLLSHKQLLIFIALMLLMTLLDGINRIPSGNLAFSTNFQEREKGALLRSPASRPLLILHYFYEGSNVFWRNITGH